MTYIGQCDVCGADNRRLTNLVVYGIDTAACAPCRGYPEEDEAEETQLERIDRLIAEEGTQ